MDRTGMFRNENGWNGNGWNGNVRECFIIFDIDIEMYGTVTYQNESG